jgi:hypothetical protein
VAACWRTLEETARAAWVAAAKETESNPRLGQSGALSGFLLCTRINGPLTQFGQEAKPLPPPFRGPYWPGSLAGPGFACAASENSRTA